MPQLPSGRHIAIQLNPLDDLLRNAGSPDSVHRIMAIKDVESLADYVQIIFLVPDTSDSKGSLALKFDQKSLPCPADLVVKDSGYTLAQFSELSVGWPDEDKMAFRGFLDDRCQDLFAAGLREVERAKQWLLDESGMPARWLAQCYLAGCHPCQEDGWDESRVGSPEWDTYDMLAALGQLSALLPQHPDIVSRLGFALDRLQGVWRSLQMNFPIPPDWPSLESDVSECANSARRLGWLSAISEDRQHWLRQQCVIESVNLWNAYGDGFQMDFPKQYRIIELVVVSREADACFEL